MPSYVMIYYIGWAGHGKPRRGSAGRCAAGQGVYL